SRRGRQEGSPGLARGPERPRFYGAECRHGGDQENRSRSLRQDRQAGEVVNIPANMPQGHRFLSRSVVMRLPVPPCLTVLVFVLGFSAGALTAAQEEPGKGVDRY